MRQILSRSRVPLVPLLMLAFLVLGSQPPRVATYTPIHQYDLLAYLQAVGSTGKSFVAGLLAPRFDVRRALELLRGHLGRPWPAVGLPRLDPLDVRDAPFHLDDEELGSWSGRVERTRVIGLASFRADSLVVEPLALSVTFNATWRRLDIIGRYVLNGSLAGLVPSRGRGPFNVTLWDARVWGHLQFGSERPTLYVRDLQLGLSLGEATGRIQGLRGAGSPAPDPVSATEDPRALRVGALLSETTLDMAPLMVETAAPRLSARVAEAVRDALDKRLREGRAASTVAMAWARAAAAADRVLALGRPAIAPVPTAPTTAPEAQSTSAPEPAPAPGVWASWRNATANSTWGKYLPSIYN